jgi:hypothetical protein
VCTNFLTKERNRDLTILIEGVISLFHFISSKNVTCNSSKKFKRIPRHFAYNKIDSHNITEILLKGALNTIIPTL